MNATQIINALEWVEVSNCYEADTRRQMRAEREALAAAVQSGDAIKIGMVVTETKRVAKMWGVDLENIRMPPNLDPFTVRIRLLDATSPNEMSRSVYIMATDPDQAVHVGMRDALAHGGRHQVEVCPGHHGYFSPDERLRQVVATWDMHTDALTIEPEGGAS